MKATRTEEIKEQLRETTGNTGNDTLIILPPFIKGIDGIVSRPPNQVNHSTLNGKSMETRKQPGNETRRKFKKYVLQKSEKQSYFGRKRAVILERYNKHH